MKFIPEEYIDPDIVKGFLRDLTKTINTTFTEVLPEALISREAWIGWYIIGATSAALAVLAIGEAAYRRMLRKYLER